MNAKQHILKSRRWVINPYVISVTDRHTYESQFTQLVQLSVSIIQYLYFFRTTTTQEANWLLNEKVIKSQVTNIIHRLRVTCIPADY